MKAINLMKSLTLAVGVLILPASNTKADVAFSASVEVNSPADFYAPLESDGAWIEVGAYGRCWHPTHIAVGWRPYCDGHWVWTDCGWYWASDEPWAWACYHYGRWHHHPVHGWVWIPGTEWAPAWVSWRVSSAHVGWAPLPPPGVALAAPSFAFVSVHNFREPVRPRKVIVNDAAVFRETRKISNIKRETRKLADAGPKEVVVNEGPGVELIQKASHQEIKPVPVQQAAQATPVPDKILKKQARPGDNGKDGEKQPAATKQSSKPEGPESPSERKVKREEKRNVIPDPGQPGVPPVAPTEPGKSPNIRKREHIPSERLEPTPVPPRRGSEKPHFNQDIKPAPEQPTGPSVSPAKPSGPSEGKEHKPKGKRTRPDRERGKEEGKGPR